MSTSYFNISTDFDVVFTTDVAAIVEVSVSILTCSDCETSNKQAASAKNFMSSFLNK